MNSLLEEKIQANPAMRVNTLPKEDPINTQDTFAIQNSDIHTVETRDSEETGDFLGKRQRGLGGS